MEEITISKGEYTTLQIEKNGKRTVGIGVDYEKIPFKKLIKSGWRFSVSYRDIETDREIIIGRRNVSNN